MKLLIITDTFTMAQQLRSIYKDATADVKVVTTGSSLLGSQFDAIKLQDVALTPKALDWLTMAVLCRLTPQAMHEGRSIK